MQEDLVRLVKTASGVDELAQVSDNYMDVVHEEAHKRAPSKWWTVSFH